MSELVHKTLSITKEQDSFVKTHKSINLSGLLQETIDDIIKQKGLDGNPAKNNPSKPVAVNPEGSKT